MGLVTVKLETDTVPPELIVEEKLRSAPDRPALPCATQLAPPLPSALEVQMRKKPGVAPEPATAASLVIAPNVSTPAAVAFPRFAVQGRDASRVAPLRVADWKAPADFTGMAPTLL